MIARLIDIYKLWHEYLKTFPKTSRYSIGVKIDGLFTETIESVVTASFLPKEQKLPYIRKAISKLDTLKVFLQISWEIKSLETKKYIAMSEPLQEIGRQLGGWHNQIVKQNSPTKAGEK